MRVGRRRRVVVLGLAALVTVAVATPAPAKDDRDKPRRSEEGPRWASPLVERIAHDVEDIRGLTFELPVPVHVLPSEEFEREATGGGDDASFDRDLERTDRMLAVLGSYDSDDDLFGALEDSGTGLLGYYDGEVHVRGDLHDIATRVVLAHELTHALHDQAFGYGFAGDDLAALGSETLTEGDAQRVAFLFLARQSDADRERFSDALAELGDGFGTDPRFPEVWLSAGAAPYDFGEAMTRTMTAMGGNQLLDEYFMDRPPDDSWIVNPLRIGSLHHEDPTVPKLPDGAKRVGASITLGAFSLFHLLANRLDPAVALAAADQWNGGRRALYRLGDQDCVRAVFEARDKDGFDGFARAFEDWAAQTGNAVVTAASPLVTFDACGTPTADPRSSLSADHYAYLRYVVVEHAYARDHTREEIECLVDAYGSASSLEDAISAEDPERRGPSPRLRGSADEFRKSAREACGADPGPIFSD